MTSPTVIRHAKLPTGFALVVTYFETRKGRRQMSSAFQVYRMNDQGDTALEKNSVWDDENAVRAYDEFMLGQTVHTLDSCDHGNYVLTNHPDGGQQPYCMTCREFVEL